MSDEYKRLMTSRLPPVMPRDPSQSMKSFKYQARNQEWAEDERKEEAKRRAEADKERQEAAARARQEEIARRRQELLNRPEIGSENVREDWENRAHQDTFSKPRKPKTVMVDGTETPTDEAVANVPKQMDFEQYLLSSPFRERALRRRRTEELVAEGLGSKQAEDQSIKEQKGRSSAYETGRADIRSYERDVDKEARSVGGSLVSSVLAPASRLFNYGQFANEVEAREAGVQAEMSQFRDENYEHPYMAGMISSTIQSAGQMVPGMIVSATGNPPLGLTMMAGQFGAQAYSQAEYEGAESGLAGIELEKYASIKAATEASVMTAMSMIPGLGGIEGRVLRQNIARGVAKHPTIRMAIKSGTKELSKDSVAEVIEEVTAGVLGGFTDEKILDKKVDYQRIIADSATSALLLTGTIGGIQIGAEVADIRNANRQAPAVPPEIEAFSKKPSETNYDAAVKAGMPLLEKDGVPIEKPNRAARAKYAADMLQNPFGMRKPDPRMDTSPNVQPPKAPPATAPVVEQAVAPDAEYEQLLNQFINLYEKGDQNNAQAETSTEKPEAAKGQAEGVLKEPEEVPPVATGGPSPDQSSKEAGPVSKLPEHARIEKGDDGLFYPSWSKPNKLPQSSFRGFETEQEAVDWLKPKPLRTGPITLPHADPVKGSIGYNNHGLPIFEGKTGIRRVEGGENRIEQASGLKDVKGTMTATFATPREDYFKTQAELDADKAPEAEPEAEPPVPGFAALPQKSQDLFNKAFESKDADSLKQMVAKNNVAWNTEFQNRTGIKLPTTVKGRHQAVLDWAAPLGKPDPAAAQAEAETEEDVSVPPLDGSRFTHEGKEFEVWGSRHGVTTAHPVVSGKPVVNRDSATRFASSDLGQIRNPDLPRMGKGQTAKIDKPAAAPPAGMPAKVSAKAPETQENKAKAEVETPPPAATKPSGTYAIYGDKIVPVEGDARTAFRFAAMRVADNAGEGFVVTPKGEVFQITKSSKLAKPITGAKADEVLARVAAKSDTAELDAALLAGLMAELAPEAAAPKPVKAPKATAPAPAKPPRSKIGKITEAAKDSAIAEEKAAFAEFLEDTKDMKFFTGLSVLNPKAVAATVRLTAKLAKLGTVTFADFVVKVVENTSREAAFRMAPYLERAWAVLKQVPGYENVDDAGKVADVLGPEKEVTNEDSTGTTDTSGRQEDSSGSTGDRGDIQDATGTTDDTVLDGTPPADDGAAEVEADPEGTRDSAGGKVRSGSGETDNGGVDAAGGRGADSGGTTDDDAGERGTGRDRAPTATRPNYHMTNPEAIIGGGMKAKFKRNRKAIEIVRDVEESNRAPTTEELDTLAGYMGWGAFKQELFQGSWKNPRVKDGWEDQDEWLRIHLGEEEWESAQLSIVNAHFTDPQTVVGIWDMLRRMGFTGGRVFEPSMGIGNFFSGMPRDLMDRSILTGIELDKITSKIAKLLHPQANIQQKGYQESKTPDNFYDVIVSNVPFGKIPISDRRYKQTFSIHNYFFKKAFDQVKPGGVIAFLTSNMTMDGQVQARLMRAQIAADGGDLVTAIRLPSGAFQAYAGTKVVADLIIIRKRKEGEQPQGDQNWYEINEVDTPAGQTIKVNEYWQNNPQNILGTMTWGHGTTSNRPGMIVDPPADLQARLNEAVQSVPENIINTERTASEGHERANTTARRQNSVLAEANELWIVKGEHLVPLIDFAKWYTMRKGVKPKQAVIDKNRKEIESLLSVREAMRSVLDKQASSEDATDARAALNRTYDAFVKAYGPITKSAAAKHLRKAGDPMGNTLLSLEKVTGLVFKKYAKRPIFERSTVRQRKSIEAPSLKDAFAIERNRSLDLNMDRIAAAAGMPVKEAIQKMEEDGQIYNTGTGTYDAADVFLSGNMARKLRQLEAAQAEGAEGLDRSIAAIRERIPEAIPYSQIEAKLGAVWVEAADYAGFIGELLNEPSSSIVVERRITGWKATIPAYINGKTEARSTHGHRNIDFSKLITAAMNNGTVKLTMPDPDGGNHRVTDTVATEEANEKISELREKYQNWIWASPDRIDRLSSVYNEEFNSTVTPTFDDVPLDFEGMTVERGDKPFNLRKHQASAIWRGIVSGKGIFAHEVGTGKTLTMAGLAMESRRLGLASKPLLLAHNANSLAVRNEIQEAYPSANILYVDNLDAANKDATLQSIATENWDLIVIPHSMVERFQLRPETVRALLKPEMDALEAAAQDAYDESEASTFAKGHMPHDLDTMTMEDLRYLKEPTAKELVNERLKLREQIEKAVQAMNRGTGIFFEDMGIDMVMIDEAHVFKKLPITSRQSIKGLNKKGSIIGTNVMLLTDYIRSNNKGRGVYLFTGTPITNTINEIFNMMRFVMAEELESSNIRGWDAWFNNFATSEILTELSSGGTWENFERLSSFVNLPELRQMVGQYMDIVFADDMPEFVPRESREGRSEDPIGRPFKQVHNVVIDMIPEQRAYSEDLAQRYIRFRDSTGREKVRMMREIGGRYNPLVIEGEGVKLAMDPRLVGFGIKEVDGKMVTDTDVLDPKDPDLKINKMIANAMPYYHEHPKASQMIFMQVGYEDTAERTVGRTRAGEPIKQTFRIFNLAKEIKRRLMEEGVPEAEIVIFSALSKEKRTEAAVLMKQGLIRFAIGSTETMGTGINAQDELIAMHHLDAPWMPGDLEQRNGRGHRQGNKWNTVHEHRYLTEGPQDGRRWQVLLTKSKFITDFMRGDSKKRVIEMDDMDMSDSGTGTDMQQTFASAAGDPRIMQRIRLNGQVEKLERMRDSYAQTITESVRQANSKLSKIKKESGRADTLAAMHATWTQNKTETPEITLRNKKFIGNQAITDELQAIGERYHNSVHQRTQIGEYRGLPLFVDNGILYVGSVLAETNTLSGITSGTWTTLEASREARIQEQVTARWNLQSLQGILSSLPERINKMQDSMASDRRFIEMANKAVGSPYPKQQQLDTKRRQLDRLNVEMNLNPTPAPSWLRAGAPIGTDVYWKGTKYEVAGHRMDHTIPFVLYSEGDEFMQIRASELTDAEGTPLFPDMEKNPTIPVTQANMPTGFELIAPGDSEKVERLSGIPGSMYIDGFLSMWHIFTPGGFTITGVGADTAEEAYARARGNPDFREFFPKLTAIQEPATPPAAPPESDLRKTAAGKDAFFIQNQKKKNAGYYQDFRNQWNRMKSTPGVGAAITPEMLRAAGNIVVGEIRLGATRFSVLIKNLRDEFDDTIVNHLKPTLIAMWNANQAKHGLDDATPELFDELMSDTVDVDVEKAIEAAKAATPAAEAGIPATDTGTPDGELPPNSLEIPTVPDDSRTIPERSPDGDEKKIGINIAMRAERRDEIGVGPEDIVDKVGHSFPELDAEAKQVAEGYAEEVFTEIGKGGVSADNATDRDVFVMLNHIAQMQNDTEKTQNALEAAQKAGDDVTVVELERKLHVQITEEVRLMNIAKSAGTAAGRALAAFKALLNKDMSLARLRMRLDAAADGKPTFDQTKALNALKAKHEALEKELEAKTKEADAAIARAEIAEQIAEQLRTQAVPGAKKPTIIERIAQEGKKNIDKGFKALSTMRGKSYSIETATAETFKALYDIALGYSQIGVSELADFLSRVNKRFGKDAKEFEPGLIQAFNQVQAEKAAGSMPESDSPSDPPEVSIEPDHPESLVQAAKALFRYFLEQGITDTDAVIDAVHEELQNQFPDEVRERLDTMKAMVNYDKELRLLSQDPIDIRAADMRAVVQMQVHLERMRRGIAAKRIEQRYPDTDEKREHRKLVAEAKRKGGFVVTDPEREATSALAAIETRLRHTISDTLNEIATRARTVPNKTVSPTSDTTEDLQAYLALVRRMHKAIFGDRQMTQEQRLKAAEASAVKNEAFWNERLDRVSKGDFSTGKKEQDPVTNANIAAIKARTDFAKAQVQFLNALANPKPDPEVLSDLRYIASLEKQMATKLARIADITARSAAGDFTPERNPSKEKREANAQRRKSDASIRDARIELDKTTRALNELIDHTRKSNMTYVDLAKKVPGGVYSLVRDMFFGGEMSFILKQGGPHVFGTLAPAGKILRSGYEAITGNPDAAKVKLRQARQGYGKLGRALAGSLRAMLWKTDTELARSQDAIKQRPGYKNGMYNAMGVPVEDNGKFTVKEEVFLNNLVETGGLALDKRFPGFKGFRDGSPRFTGVAHNLNLANRFSNATKVFMSTIRADIADNAAEVWTMKRGEMTPAEARSFGRITNMLTGKGDMASIGMDQEQALGFLGRIFISAPWIKSRFEMLFDPLLSLNPWSSRRTLESRKIAAELYVDAAAGVAAYYSAIALAAMFYNDDDDEKPVVEWDSTSSDFGQPRFGKTRVDPLWGLLQIIVMGSRMYHGTVKDHRGDIQKRDGNSDLFGLAGQFLKGRLHPVWQAGVSIYTQQDFSGQPITTKEVLMQMPVPVTYPDIVEASKNRGIPASTVLGVLAFAGQGMRTNQPRTKDRRDIAEELRYVQRKINNPNTTAEMRKSLQIDADTILEAHLVNAAKSQARDDEDTAMEEKAASHKPGTPLSPELTAAIEKEKYDIIIAASSRVSTDKRLGDEEVKFSGDDDRGNNTARKLISLMFSSEKEATDMYHAAYKAANRTLLNEDGITTKKSVAIGRIRIKQIYKRTP